MDIGIQICLTPIPMEHSKGLLVSDPMVPISQALSSRGFLLAMAVASVSVLEAIFLEEAVDLEEDGRRSKNVRRPVDL